MNHDCQQCSKNFEITNDDLEFYKKVSPRFKGKNYDIPPPTLCPDCRQQRRLSFRNENKLYKASCELCNKDLVSMYDHPKAPVHCPSCWWGDTWDPLKYGQEFDFSKTFFEQFQELFKKVPKGSTVIYKSENCDFNTLIGLSKNCYMSPGSYDSQDLFYCRKTQYSSDCIDGLFVDNCELVYEGINCKNCYNCTHIINSKNCHDSSYLEDCDSCDNCFMCAGLRRKKYHIKNVEYSKEEYAKSIKELKQKDPDELKNEFSEFSKTIPKKYQHQFNSENSNGDYFQNCKNVKFLFDGYNNEDCKYCYDSSENKDMMDTTNIDKNNELCYESIGGGDQNNTAAFNILPILSNNIYYCQNVNSSQNCFGCVGLKSKKQYCILNKQYTKAEYEELVPKIIEHMKDTGEWGEFFPAEISPFAYNETTAQECFPLKKEKVLNKGWKWKEVEDKISNVEKIIPAEKLPTDITKIPDDVLNWAIQCEETKRPFKIQKSELRFYRKMNLPIPHFHPDVRHKHRMAKRNPRKLWERNCGECNAEIKTTYAPERPERVLCEKCYLKEIS